jgi:hypothetical protein
VTAAFTPPPGFGIIPWSWPGTIATPAAFRLLGIEGVALRSAERSAAARCRGGADQRVDADDHHPRAHTPTHGALARTIDRDNGPSFETLSGRDHRFANSKRTSA